MLVNQHPHLSPSLYKKYSSIAKFKANFHKIYILAHKDTKKTWHPLPYLVIEDNLLEQIQQWPTEWITTLDTQTEDTPSEEDTTQHEEVIGKDKDKEDLEQDEQ